MDTLVAMSELKDILERGVEGEFWQWFERKVLAEWGPNGAHFQHEMDRALDMTDNDAAASQARQVRSGQKVILGLLRLPHDELRKLRDATVTTTDMRRAPMPDELVGMSRRGAGL